MGNSTVNNTDTGVVKFQILILFSTFLFSLALGSTKIGVQERLKCGQLVSVLRHRTGDVEEKDATGSGRGVVAILNTGEGAAFAQLEDELRQLGIQIVILPHPIPSDSKALEPQGYIYGPRWIGWSKPLHPNPIEKTRSHSEDWFRHAAKYWDGKAQTWGYLEGAGKLGQQFRQRLKKSEGIRTQIQEVDPAVFDQWYDIYEATVVQAPLGTRTLKRTWVEDNRGKTDRFRMVSLYDGSTYLGGSLILLDPQNQILKIHAVATARSVSGKDYSKASLGLRAFDTAVQWVLDEKAGAVYQNLSYGSDAAAPFGFTSALSLGAFKTSLGFRLGEPMTFGYSDDIVANLKSYQLMKVLDPHVNWLGQESPPGYVLFGKGEGPSDFRAYSFQPRGASPLLLPAEIPQIRYEIPSTR